MKKPLQALSLCAVLSTVTGTNDPCTGACPNGVECTVDPFLNPTCRTEDLCSNVVCTSGTYCRVVELHTGAVRWGTACVSATDICQPVTCSATHRCEVDTEHTPRLYINTVRLYQWNATVTTGKCVKANLSCSEMVCNPGTSCVEDGDGVGTCVYLDCSNTTCEAGTTCHMRMGFHQGRFCSPHHCSPRSLYYPTAVCEPPQSCSGVTCGGGVTCKERRDEIQSVLCYVTYGRSVIDGSSWSSTPCRAESKILVTEAVCEEVCEGHVCGNGQHCRDVNGTASCIDDLPDLCSGVVCQAEGLHCEEQTVATRTCTIYYRHIRCSWSGSRQPVCVGPDLCAGIECSEPNTHCEVLNNGTTECVGDDICTGVTCPFNTICEETSYTTGTDDVRGYHCVQHTPCTATTCPTGTTCRLYDARPYCIGDVDMCKDVLCPEGSHCKVVENTLEGDVNWVTTCVDEATICSQLHCAYNHRCEVTTSVGRLNLGRLSLTNTTIAEGMCMPLTCEELDCGTHQYCKMGWRGARCNGYLSCENVTCEAGTTCRLDMRRHAYDQYYPVAVCEAPESCSSVVCENGVTCREVRAQRGRATCFSIQGLWYENCMSYTATVTEAVCEEVCEGHVCGNGQHCRDVNGTASCIDDLPDLCSGVVCQAEGLHCEEQEVAHISTRWNRVVPSVEMKAVCVEPDLCDGVVCSPNTHCEGNSTACVDDDICTGNTCPSGTFCAPTAKWSYEHATNVDAYRCNKGALCETVSCPNETACSVIDGTAYCFGEDFCANVSCPVGSHCKVMEVNGTEGNETQWEATCLEVQELCPCDEHLCEVGYYTMNTQYLRSPRVDYVLALSNSTVLSVDCVANCSDIVCGNETVCEDSNGTAVCVEVVGDTQSGGLGDPCVHVECPKGMVCKAESSSKASCHIEEASDEQTRDPCIAMVCPPNTHCESAQCVPDAPQAGGSSDDDIALVLGLGIAGSVILLVGVVAAVVYCKRGDPVTLQKTHPDAPYGGEGDASGKGE